MRSCFRECRHAAIAAALAALAGCGAPPGDFVGESSDALRVCAKGSTVEGIDVSTYQGTINWAQVTTSNVRFAVTRISDGLNYQDVQFNRNWAAIKDAGLIRGAYQFFEPGLDAMAQANMVVSKVGKLGPNDLPVQLDMEVTGGQSAATIVSRMKIWIERVTAGTGKRPMIYSAKYFWNDNIASREFNSYALWVANYGVTCPDMPDPWSNWTIWQYSDNRTVPGISGGVDADKFNGTLDELKALTGGPAPDNAPEAGAADGAAKNDVNVPTDPDADALTEAAAPSGDPAVDAADPSVPPDAGVIGPTSNPDTIAPIAAANVVGDDSGCACHVGTTRRGAPGWLLLALLPWLRRRREWRCAS
jgi:lysozyme